VAIDQDIFKTVRTIVKEKASDENYFEANCRMPALRVERGIGRAAPRARLEGVWKLGKRRLAMENCGYYEQKTIPNRPLR